MKRKLYDRLRIRQISARDFDTWAESPTVLEIGGVGTFSNISDELWLDLLNVLRKHMGRSKPLSVLPSKRGRGWFESRIAERKMYEVSTRIVKGRIVSRVERPTYSLEEDSDTR